MNAVESFVAVPGNDVAPGKKPLATSPYEEALKRALGAGELEAYSRDTKRLLAPEVNGYAHGFIAAANAAYDGHYPLVISPDMIWLLIAQGFAIHVKENAEALRGKFVAHEGKAQLEVRRDEFVRGFAGNDWESIFAEFSAQIRAHIGESAYETIAPTFSTTGIVEKAAFEVTLMDAMQEYFDYGLLTACGIPFYRLCGNSDDWKNLRAIARNLEKFDLKWWTDFLIPILDEFIAASEGRSNSRFWRDFFKVSGQSGGPYIQGHIVNLFPYFAPKQYPRQSEKDIRRKLEQWSLNWKTPEEETKRRIEELVKKEKTKQEEVIPVHRNRYLGFGLPEDHDSSRRFPFRQTGKPNDFGPFQGMLSGFFPSGLSTAPFTWKNREAEIPMEFVAGFMGASQDAKTLAIRPEIGWAVRER